MNGANAIFAFGYLCAGFGMANYLMAHWPGAWRYWIDSTCWPAHLVYVAMIALERAPR